MKQGYSGSTVRRLGNLVEKISSDENFVQSKERQKDLIAISQRIAVLPRIDHIDGRAMYMEYVYGQGGLTKQNARQVGKSLRLLHDQRDFNHPCMTGLNWLIQLANTNLERMGQSERIYSEIEIEYPCDALIHSEPDQFIEKMDGSIKFIDFEGIGLGSRYQDLGFIYFSTLMSDSPESFITFMDGYQAAPVQIEQKRIKKLAGIIAIAYSWFAETEKRSKIGLSLLNEPDERTQES